jgi:chaperonin GroEL (HSP60 family)
MGYNAFKDKDCNMLDSGVVTPLISFIDIIEVIKDVAVAWLVTESAIFTDYNDKGEDKNGN